MTLIRPRLNDFFDLEFSQSDVDFAIPFMNEDIPLYIDPFLLWKSPSLQDNSFHTVLTNCFNHLGYLTNNNKENEAINLLVECSDCFEVGLGLSKNRIGKRISEGIAKNIIALFKNIPQIRKSGFVHFEEIQLYIDGISQDRISDLSCNFLKSFLIDYTIDQSNEYKIPINKIDSIYVYDYKKNKIVEEKDIYLPQNPETKQPILLVPKRWLRKMTWINYEDYIDNYYLKEIESELNKNKIEILNYNRKNYDVVRSYIKIKELQQDCCKNDPLFLSLSLFSIKRKMSSLLKLSFGRINKADKKYEDYCSQIFSTLLYPDLDFAAAQSRTDSGVLIRDLIFYNNRTDAFLKDLYNDFHSRQVIMEIKNVSSVNTENINQLNRYLGEHFGKFGVIVTRNRLQKNIFRNTIDLWSGQRKCIIAISDEDLNMMVSLYEDKQRKPLDVIKKKQIEFIRLCPS
jgi:hypothetical protein